jgi:hypothetical protein
MVPAAVFLEIRVVRMSWPEGLLDVAVVLAAGVLVADEERDRRAGGPAFEHA